MFDINFIEKLTESLLSGNNSKASSILQKEAGRARNRKKNLIGKRLDNLAKKIPSKSKFGVASLSPSKPFQLSNSQLVTEYIPSVFLDEVILNQDARNAVSSLFKEWQDYDRLVKHGLQPMNRILLYGPPGTGKTKLANAIANKLGLPLILVRLDELVSSFLGQTGKNIREIFETAHERRVVLFLDEIDTIAKHRADDKELGELKRIVTVLLQNIDLFPTHSIVIGATNHEHILDKAIWRRFPLKIQLDLPISESRASLIDLFLKKVPKDFDKDFVVKITDGMNGSEIFDLSQQALKEHLISGREKLQTRDILVAYFQLLLGKQMDKRTDKKGLYQMAQKLKNAGYSFRDIESITQIPYTTLKDNLT